MGLGSLLFLAICAASSAKPPTILFSTFDDLGADTPKVSGFLARSIERTHGVTVLERDTKTVVSSSSVASPFPAIARAAGAPTYFISEIKRHGQRCSTAIALVPMMNYRRMVQTRSSSCETKALTAAIEDIVHGLARMAAEPKGSSASIAGRLIDENEAPIGGVLLLLSTWGFSEDAPPPSHRRLTVVDVIDETVTDSRGHFRLRAPDAEEYVIRVCGAPGEPHARVMGPARNLEIQVARDAFSEPSAPGGQREVFRRDGSRIPSPCGRSTRSTDAVR